MRIASTANVVEQDCRVHTLSRSGEEGANSSSYEYVEEMPKNRFGLPTVGRQ